MAPAIISALRARLVPAPVSDLASLGPLTAHSILVARSGAHQVDPESGLIHPHDINNNAVFAIFGILGAAFVIVGIWFFFWAKNGGFVFKENDWDEYKSTVLRRKGPNGTTLSGATESTVLGGGSVYKDVDDGTAEADNTTVISATTGITGITGGVSDILGREKRRKKREQKEREKERRREEKVREKEEKKRGKRRVGADGVLVDEEAEYEAKEHLRSYRHEKPARVGGINKQSEASEWDGSTNPSYSSASGSGVGHSTESGSTVTSELISHRERTPTSTPTKLKKAAEERSERPSERATGGIRKVYSTADKNDRRENERLRAEARRLAEKGRAAAASSHRRDFSWQRTDETMALRRIDEHADSVVGESVVSGSTGTESYVTESYVTESVAPESRIPGSWAESDVGTASDAGTKVYRHSHHIPVPSSTAASDFAYQDEKRKKRRSGAPSSHRRARGGDGGSSVA